MFFAKQYGLAVEYRRNWFQEKYPYSMCPRGVVNGRGLEKSRKSVPPYGNTAQFPPNGLSTAPADLRAKSRRKASVALRSASLRLGVRHAVCVAKMLENVGLRYPHRASGTKAPRTLRPLPLLRFAVSATGGAHLCSIQYYLHFWLSICRTSLAVSTLRIMR